MLIKQISVFVENVPGKLVEVSQILGDNGIDMSALSLADSSDFGILRLIVNDPDKAYQVLRDHAFVVKQSDVIAAVIDDRPGGLTAVLRILAEAKVSVEYMYAFVGNRQDGHAVVVMRTDNEEIAQQAWTPTTFPPYPPKISTVYNAATSSLAPARSLPLAAGGFFSVLDRSRRFLYNIIRRYQETIFQRGGESMPKKSMESLTESMFYVLMAFLARPMCGIEVTEFIEILTQGRIQMGPATLYTILGKFEAEQYIQETAVEGRKRTYAITEKGRAAYAQELARLHACLQDAQRVETGDVPAPASPDPALRPALATP